MRRAIRTAQRVMRSLKITAGLLTACLVYGVVLTQGIELKRRFEKA